ncbi:Zinc transporter [Coemansia erecta]|uniref:Zinc transporter n=1 Tax=Coemansia erecta TaxID=147472 RepID=A0A9W8CPL4_9FUNG|nr:Zinc transporter [Coemansia erecta]
MGDSSTGQAWLFAMTSGLASALGGASLYIDPLLHLLGVAPRSNVLDSHTVLSALLSGASGIMAYTSISVLTRESIEYLSQLSGWPLVGKYPGAAAAVLFVLGAHLNLLLLRVVSRLTPADSPIGHTCASHPPSPSAEAGMEDGMAKPADSSSGIISGGSHCHGQSHHGVYREGEGQPLLSRSSETVQQHESQAHCCSRNRHRQQQQQHPCDTTHRCEYACAKPNCYGAEHCHITPLYPHMHTHTAAENEPCGSHNHSRSRSCLHQSSPESHRCSHSPSPRVSIASSCSGDGMVTTIGSHHHNHHHHNHHNHHHHHAHAGDGHDDEPEVQLSGPGDSTASQVSSRHQRLLLHVGLQTAVAIALHKIPEGLIIFLSRRASPKLGASVAASLFFHNLPEGLMLALPLYLATGRRHRAFLLSALMGAVPPALGAALGMLVAGSSGRNAHLAAIFGVTFGVTAGMMCMVSLNGMLPTARIYDRSGNVVAWCFALGVAAMLFANTSLK